MVAGVPNVMASLLLLSVLIEYALLKKIEVRTDTDIQGGQERMPH